MQSSPAWPRASVAPVSGSAILTSRWGWTWPTVETRLSSGVSVLLWQLPGLVSVMP